MKNKLTNFLKVFICVSAAFFWGLIAIAAVTEFTKEDLPQVESIEIKSGQLWVYHEVNPFETIIHYYRIIDIKDNWVKFDF